MYIEEFWFLCRYRNFNSGIFSFTFFYLHINGIKISLFFYILIRRLNWMFQWPNKHLVMYWAHHAHSHTLRALFVCRESDNSGKTCSRTVTCLVLLLIIWMCNCFRFPCWSMLTWCDDHYKVNELDIRVNLQYALKNYWKTIIIIAIKIKACIV